MPTTPLINRTPVPTPTSRPSLEAAPPGATAPYDITATGSSVSVGDARAIYDAFRRQIEHEDNLLNNRASWLLMAQSFFVVAYSILHQLAPPDASVQPTTALLTSLLGWLGFLTPIPTLVSVHAASRVMVDLRDRFAELRSRHFELARLLNDYPALQPTDATLPLGRFSAVVFPFLFVLFWGAMIIKTWMTQGVS